MKKQVRPKVWTGSMRIKLAAEWSNNEGTSAKVFRGCFAHKTSVSPRHACARSLIVLAFQIARGTTEIDSVSHKAITKAMKILKKTRSVHSTKMDPTLSMVINAQPVTSNADSLTISRDT